MNYSPLRYPGGKSCLTSFITELADLNGVTGGIYLELYAGGAGAALNLLFNNTFSHIHINDYDFRIYAMWYSILNHPRAFINRINSTEITIHEWHKQKAIFQKGSKSSFVDLGFATFFLNRTNRSGILNAGPIGGLDQSGNYKIDVRFKKENLINRISEIAKRRNNITLTNLDARIIISDINHYYQNTNNLFLYLDPPYYKKGKELYMNNYNHSDHLALSETMNYTNNLLWLISYDNVNEIRVMYNNFRKTTFDLNYTVQNKKIGSELLIFSNTLQYGNNITIKSKSNELILLEE